VEACPEISSQVSGVNDAIRQHLTENEAGMHFDESGVLVEHQFLFWKMRIALQIGNAIHL
jgi:hypothetical protein